MRPGARHHARWIRLSTGLAPALLAGALAGPAEARGVPAGALQEVIGPGTCVSERRVGCLRHPHFDGASDAAVAPDGRHLYVLSSETLLVFARDAAGRLTALSGPRGCLARWAPPPAGASGHRARHRGIANFDRPTPPGCSLLPGLSGVGFSIDQVVVSGDGRHVYIAGIPFVLALERDPATGGLVPLPAPSGCLAVQQDGPDPACTPLRGLDPHGPLALSPDGRNLYVVGANRDAEGVVTLVRDPESGALAQPAGTRGCVGSSDPACLRARGLRATRDVAVSPDGRHVYVTGARAEGTDTGIAVFARDPADGALSQLAGPAGCVLESGGPCGRVPGLGGPDALAITPDGRHVVALDQHDEAAPIVLARDPSSGGLSATGSPRPRWPLPDER